jgi:FkbM family methyltransferase
VFGEHECEISLPEEPRFIIDGGAYTGYTTTYFANHYPHARIAAIEPDPENFDILRQNCSGYKNVTLIQGGLWVSAANLVLNNGTSKKWAVRLDEAQAQERGSIKGITISGLLQQSGFDIIDILKLDIEGAEERIFSDESDEWLKKVTAIIIETHGKDCEEAVFKATSRHDFIISRNGEKKVFIRPSAIKNEKQNYH